ncbi:hypothetical protein Clacol_004238 [Clathrus columnatus]|uniref:ABC transporter domain-containing protein n=1 Tax=Clathrus columnatus TaxID=1419009 RepID=A0AAV5A8L1_9AGAM|nr:hypothetical protein Clacol_004238 [Clathrus columnatus]
MTLPFTYRIEANLKFDMPTYKDSEYINRSERYLRPYRHSEEIWDQFEKLVKVCSDVTMVFSQISFLYYLLRAQPGGVWFILVSAIRPLSERKLLSGSSLSVYRPTYRLEMISLGIKKYILREWRAAVEGLGDTPEVIPTIEAEMPNGDFTAIFRRDLISHLPLMFYSYQVYLDPKAFSLSSIALMQQATSMVGEILENLFGRPHHDPIDFEWMKSLYEDPSEMNVIRDGETIYPPTDIESSNGMEVKFENVSFTYPKGKEPVLNDISFTIKKGQTVVIVGMNGSGKSTLLKLINRIYDVSSGTVYVDNQSFISYVTETVQHAMAILFQEFNHLPVSIAENIFLGCSDPDGESDADLKDINHEKTRQAIHRAAELGGSLEIIDKQKKGLDTTLYPLLAIDYKGYETASAKLKEFIEETSHYGNLSSGQWQRLALSRLFYRAAMKHVKLVAADEPSASLDPQIEYQIFSRLYELRENLGEISKNSSKLSTELKLVFKRVMKDGRLVEQGRHADLLALNAEYAKLYKVQAEAFLSDEELKESIPNTPETNTRSIDTLGE